MGRVHGEGFRETRSPKERDAGPEDSSVAVNLRPGGRNWCQEESAEDQKTGGSQVAHEEPSMADWSGLGVKPESWGWPPGRVPVGTGKCRQS